VWKIKKVGRALSDGGLELPQVGWLSLEGLSDTDAMQKIVKAYRDHDVLSECDGGGAMRPTNVAAARRRRGGAVDFEPSMLHDAG
jgi:hypothetical protein